MSTLDFWFDFSSPFAYLASTQIDALAARTGAALRWRPMLLGAIFRTVGSPDVPLFAMNPTRRDYYTRDIARAADFLGVPLRFNPHFPLRTVLPLRVFLAHPTPIPFAHAVYRAAWAEEQDVSQPEVLLGCGATPALIDAAAEQKQALIDSTSAALAAGVFGAPTMIVDDRYLFWGQDRLNQVERCLEGWRPPG